MKTAIVILNYNSGEATANLVKVLTRNLSVDEEVIVVDNSSSDNSIQLLIAQGRYSSFKLIRSETNGGYAAGNNIGLKQAIADGCEFAVIMNSDISISDDTVSRLVSHLESHHSCAVVSPVLETAGAEDMYGRLNYLGKIHSWKSVFPDDLKHPFKVDSIVGACFAVRLSVVADVGFIPEPYFLNFEETEWCIRMGCAGYSVECLPYLRVRHQNHGSTGNVSGLQKYFMRRNLVLFNRRLGSKSEIVGLVVKLIPFAMLQCLKNGSWMPAKSYVDGWTGRNRFLEGRSVS